MNTNDNIHQDILAGVTVSLVIEDPDVGKLNGLQGYLRNYISKDVHGSITVSQNGGNSKMTLHIPRIEERKRTLVVSALERSQLNINRQQVK